MTGFYHSWWWLVVNALAVYRLTILLTMDTITQPFREWVARLALDDTNNTHGRVGQYAVTLITCPWCISVWFGAGVVALTATIPDLWQYPAAVFAFSAVAGFLAERTDH